MNKHIQQFKNINFAYFKDRLKQPTVNYYFKKSKINKNEANGLGLLKKDCIIFFTRYLTTKKNGRPVYNGRIQKTKRLKQDESWMKGLIGNTLFNIRGKPQTFRSHFKHSLNYVMKKAGSSVSTQLKRNPEEYKKIKAQILDYHIKFNNLFFLYFYGKGQISDLDNSIQLFQDELENTLQEKGKHYKKPIQKYNDRTITYNTQVRFNLPRKNITPKPDTIFVYIISF